MENLSSIIRAGVFWMMEWGKELCRRVQWVSAWAQVSARIKSCPCIVAETFDSIV